MRGECCPGSLAISGVGVGPRASFRSSARPRFVDVKNATDRIVAPKPVLSNKRLALGPYPATHRQSRPVQTNATFPNHRRQSTPESGRIHRAWILESDGHDALSDFAMRSTFENQI
jgi:hypothetical protein